jgi:hypothetical protein
MTRLRTTLLTVGAGAVVLATGAVVVGSAATATPAAVAAVADFAPDPLGASTGTVADTVAGATTDAVHSRAGTRRWWNQLSDAQRTCLRAERITRPVGPLDDSERAALRAKVEAAATRCDVQLPFARARTFWDTLTDEQRTCLEEAAVTRPWGPLTKEERQAVRADLRAAAQACGVTTPSRS